MGPSRPRNSTRARKAHAPKKPRRKLVNPLLRKAANAFRKAHEHHERAEAIFKAAQAAEPARTEQEPLPPTGVALREIRRELEVICSCAIVVRHALTDQNVELDGDAALVLKRHVSDPLHEQIERISHLLGDGPPDDDDADAEESRS